MDDAFVNNVYMHEPFEIVVVLLEAQMGPVECGLVEWTYIVAVEHLNASSRRPPPSRPNFNSSKKIKRGLMTRSVEKHNCQLWGTAAALTLVLQAKENSLINFLSLPLLDSCPLMHL